MNLMYFCSNGNLKKRLLLLSELKNNRNCAVVSVGAKCKSSESASNSDLQGISFHSGSERGEQMRDTGIL